MLERGIRAHACLAAFALGVVVLQVCTALPPAGARDAAAAALVLVGAALARHRHDPADPRATLAMGVAWALLCVGAGFLDAAARADARLSDALPREWEG